MKTYVALFRGINVGGNNLLPMKELQEILVKTGCKDVRTYLQSGNAVFAYDNTESNKLAETISSNIYAVRGFKPNVFVLKASALLDAVRNNPFSSGDTKTVHFYFLESVPESPDMEKLYALKTASEEFALAGPVFYLYTPEGFGRSKLASKVENGLGVAVTARNLNTVSNLAAMVG